MKISNIILLSLISLGIVTSFSFIYSAKQEFRVVEYSEVEGSEQLDSKMLDLNDFHSIEVSDQIRVILSQGEYNVEVMAESNLLDFVSVENHDGLLNIHQRSQNNEIIHQNMPMVVKISAPEYKSIIAGRQSEVVIEATLAMSELKLELREQGNFKGSINVEKLDMVLRQQSNATLAGKTKEFTVEVKDQAGLRAGSFIAENIAIEMDSQTDATVNSTNSITGNIRGSADLIVKGSVKDNSVVKSGNAKMID